MTQHTDARQPSALDPDALARLYFEAWQANDIPRLAPHLADDVTFDGPLAHLVGRDDCLSGLGGLAGATTRLDVRRRLADDTDVMTWFELAVGAAEPTDVVNWCHCEGGRIRNIRVTFDPRGILAAG